MGAEHRRKPRRFAMSSIDFVHDRQSIPRFDGDIAVVKVGPTEQIFKIHENILRAYSKFFDAALSRQWQSGETKVISLPEDDPETFAAYAYWQYSGLIATDNNGHQDFNAQARLFVLGEKLMNITFQNEVIDAILGSARYFNTWPTIETVEIIYLGTPRGSPARRLLVDCFVVLGTPKWMMEDSSQVHHDFLHELAIAFLKLKEGSRPREALYSGPTSAYHVPKVEVGGHTEGGAKQVDKVQ